MQTPANATPVKRAIDFAGRNYHWFFAAIAALLVLVKYVPAIFLSGLNSDHLAIPLLFHDVVEQGHAASHWNWGGHCDLFPDVSVTFLLESILRDWLLTLQVATGIMLAAYITVLILLYRQNGGRNAETFAGMLLLFFVLLLHNFGAKSNVGGGITFRNLLALTMHTSITITALGCFALCQNAVLRGSRKSFGWLLVLCAITGFSDDIFLVVFSIPAAAALVIMRFLFPVRSRGFFPVAGSILILAAATHLLAAHLSPFQTDPGAYTGFKFATAANAFRVFLKLLAPSAGGYFVVLVIVDFLFVISATVLLCAWFSKRATKSISSPLFFLLLFSVCIIGCNWGAAILTGNFIGTGAIRHVRLATLLPIFLSLGYINHHIPWTGNTSRITVTLLSLATSLFTVFLSPPPNDHYLETQQLIPILRTIMEKEHIEAGLADYWHANPIAFFSQNALPIRSIDADGSLLHWMNTDLWYTGDGASNPPPQFRLILMANLDQDEIRRCFGPPSRIIPAVPGCDVWIYPVEKSITYHPIFGTLSNGPLNEYRADAVSLPFITGQLEGTSRVARAGRDRPDFLTYGPHPYLQPAGGHYRITITHAYLSTPAPGRLSGFDVIYSKGTSIRTLAKEDIPFIDNSRHEFTRDIVIPENQQGLLQVRTLYGGSGDISIDSLRIVYLGK